MLLLAPYGLTVRARPPPDTLSYLTTLAKGEAGPERSGAKAKGVPSKGAEAPGDCCARRVLLEKSIAKGDTTDSRGGFQTRPYR